MVLCVVSVRHGFTLLEVMLTLSLLLVLASATLPAISGWQARIPLDHATAQVQQICQQARTSAILTGTTWTVYTPGRSREWRSQAVDELVIDPSPVTHHLGGDIESVQVTDLQQNTLRRLMFYPGGTTSAARIKLTDQHERETSLMLDRRTGTVATESTP